MIKKTDELSDDNIFQVVEVSSAVASGRQERIR
jgi:hypothetical protein